MQRIEHLEIELEDLLKFNCEIYNLIELTIGSSKQRKSMEIEKTFPNVTKLNVEVGNFDDYYDFLGKFKFPKLEHVSIWDYCDHFYEYSLPFVNQIRDVKSINYYNSYLDISLISQLNQLTSFVWQNIKLFDDSSFAKFFKCLNVLQMHKSIENITFEICDSNMLINNLFYDRLFNFCKVKPNTKIIITINKSKSEADQRFNHHKKLFDQNKHLFKFNMKIVLMNINDI